MAEPLVIERRGVTYDVNVHVPIQIQSKCAFLRVREDDGRTKFYLKPGSANDSSAGLNRATTNFFQYGSVDYLMFIDLGNRACSNEANPTTWPIVFVGRMPSDGTCLVL